MMDRLWILAVDFLMLSLLTVGGATTMLPEMHRNLVEVQGWMSSEEFAQLFALAQAAPGPNVLVISVFGWKAAGVAGALVATVAMILPSCLLTYYADGFLRSPAGAVWREAIDNALAPVAAGLLAAAGVLLARAADPGAVSIGLTVGAALLSWRTRLHPLWMIAVGAIAGVAGLA